MKALISRLVGAAYRRVFNTEMSTAEADFVQSLSWVGAGTFIATGLTAAFSILGGRLLGPEEYGKFTLVQSIAMFLYIPMLMGFDTAMLKYNAEKADIPRQKSIISTAHIMIAGLTATSVVVMLLCARPLSGLFAATPELVRFSVYFALLYALLTISQTTLRGVNRMRAFALSQPVQAIFLLTAFGVFGLLGRLTFESMVHSKLIAFAATGLGIYLLCTRGYFTLSFDTAWARTLTRFAAAYIVAAISAVVYGEIGKIIVARYMTMADVGIYGAYFIATMQIASVSWGIFNMVFFPTASKYTDKRPLLHRINRLVPLVILFGTPLLMGCGYLILLLYGQDYPINLAWLALFAAAAVLSVIRNAYAFLVTSEGPGGAFLSSGATVAVAGASLGLSILLVPAIGISGAMVAAIIAHLAGAVMLLWRGRRYLEAK